MRIEYLSSTIGDRARSMYLTTFLVDDWLAIDAGSLGFLPSPLDQAKVSHIVISHSHLDHIASLPMFLNNVQGLRDQSVHIHLSDATRSAVEQHLFNDAIWVDKRHLLVGEPPLFVFQSIQNGAPFRLHNVELIPIAVNHPVPNLGVVLRGPDACVAIPSDTGPTEEFWHVVGQERLSAVFLECSFPNRMEPLALLSGHLTPHLLRRELDKLKMPVPTYVVHIKASCYEEVCEEIAALDLPHVSIAEPGREYHF